MTDCEPNADGTKKDGSTRNCWTEKVSMVNLNWFTENNYEECGSILTQDEYGIVYEVMVQGVRSKVRTLDFLTFRGSRNCITHIRIIIHTEIAICSLESVISDVDHFR